MTRKNKNSNRQKPQPKAKQNTKQTTNSDIEQVVRKSSEKTSLDQDSKHKIDSWFSKRLYFTYAILWIYFIIKGFIVDLEVWLLEILGMERFKPFLLLRIFIIPCLIAITIRRKGNKVALRHIFHFLTVPLYFSVFLFMKSVYRQTQKSENATYLVFVLEIFGRILSRFNYYLFGLLGISALIICNYYPSNKSVHLVAFTISFILVVAVMYQSVLKVIQPQKIFGFFKIDDIIFQSKKNKHFPLQNQYGDLKPKSRVEEIRELLFSYIVVTVLQKNVSEVQKRKSFILVTYADFFVVILTITILFTFLNYNLFLIMPESFSVENSPGFGDFIFYTFYAIPGEGTSIEPASYLSKSIKVLITCYGYYLLIFFTSVLLGVFSEKYTQALEFTSSFLQQQSKMSTSKLSSITGIPIHIIRGLSLSKLKELFDSFNDKKV
jgi:hypothetical protein